MVSHAFVCYLTVICLSLYLFHVLCYVHNCFTCLLLPHTVFHLSPTAVCTLYRIICQQRKILNGCHWQEIEANISLISRRTEDREEEGRRERQADILREIESEGGGRKIYIYRERKSERERAKEKERKRKRKEDMEACFYIILQSRSVETQKFSRQDDKKTRETKD